MTAVPERGWIPRQIETTQPDAASYPSASMFLVIASMVRELLIMRSQGYHSSVYNVVMGHSYTRRCPVSETFIEAVHGHSIRIATAAGPESGD